MLRCNRHLHLWQNDRSLLCAIGVTRGWYRCLFFLTWLCSTIQSLQTQSICKFLIFSSQLESSLRISFQITMFGLGKKTNNNQQQTNKNFVSGYRGKKHTQKTHLCFWLQGKKLKKIKPDRSIVFLFFLAFEFDKCPFCNMHKHVFCLFFVLPGG